MQGIGYHMGNVDAGQRRHDPLEFIRCANRKWFKNCWQAADLGSMGPASWRIW